MQAVKMTGKRGWTVQAGCALWLPARPLCTSAGGAAMKQKSESKWSDWEARKELLDRVKQKFNIKEKEDWKRVQKRHLRECGAGGLLRMYEKHPLGSVFAAICSVYPDITEADAAICRPRLPRGYWEERENRIEYMEKVLAPRLGVKESTDWLSVSVRQVQMAGGNSLLQQYNSSLWDLLHDLYPDVAQQCVEGARSLPNGYWKSTENRRRFLTRVADAFGVEKPSDWQRVTNKDVQEMGGGSLLNAYNSSFWAVLQDTLPEAAEWEQEECRRQMPRRYWKPMERRQAFFDRLAAKHDVRSVRDWARVTHQDIGDEGGAGLMGHYDSISHALRDIYGSDHSFEVAGVEQEDPWSEIECRQAVSGKFWQETDNVTAFVRSLEKKLGIREKDDWYRVSHRQLLEEKAAGLLARMSFIDALTLTFPKETWDKAEGQRPGKKAAQRNLFVSLERIFAQ